MSPSVTDFDTYTLVICFASHLVLGSADALRKFMPSRGWDYSTMEEPPGYDTEDMDGEAMVADWDMGERRVLLYSVSKLSATQ